MKKKIRFIINPKSGIHEKHGIPGMIDRLIDQEKFEYEISFTEAPKHATVLSLEAAVKNYDVVVAVGGDGSVNETAKGLMESETALGILATGSGNGMARHLKIPMEIENAIHVINTGKTIKVDTMRVNEEFCIGTIGVGFDAHVAHLFASSSKRGYSTYVKLVLTEFYKYKPFRYELCVDGNEFQKECFLLTFANSSQFGNNAVIAPFADVQDGIIDISMMNKFPVYAAPHLIWRLMHNIIHQSKYYTGMTGEDIVLKNKNFIKGHIDGEPVTFNSDLHIKIIPKSLNVLVPLN
ncbi:MAG: YegS/Rv2252/BmrU family lipid kinase [Bacteroidetes bacterium]|nr:YegS/Rv2252/BmrU family lipid kinase [Bacteroidota bacterium]